MAQLWNRLSIVHSINIHERLELKPWRKRRQSRHYFQFITFSIPSSNAHTTPMPMTLPHHPQHHNQCPVMLYNVRIISQVECNNIANILYMWLWYAMADTCICIAHKWFRNSMMITTTADGDAEGGMGWWYWRRKRWRWYGYNDISMNKQ